MITVQVPRIIVKDEKDGAIQLGFDLVSKGFGLIQDDWASALASLSSAITGSSGLPTVRKVLVSHTQLQTAATTNNIEIFSFPAQSVLHFFALRPKVAAAGTGMTTNQLTIGLTSDLTRYLPPFEWTDAIVSTSGAVNNVVDIPDFVSASSIRLAATSDVNLDQSTAGSVEIWMAYTVLP